MTKKIIWERGWLSVTEHILFLNFFSSKTTKNIDCKKNCNTKYVLKIMEKISTTSKFKKITQNGLQTALKQKYSSQSVVASKTMYL